jgi:glycosyltransferase 2 family protein
LSGYPVARPLGIVLALLCVVFFARSLLQVDADMLVALSIDRLVASVAVWSVLYAALLAGLTVGFVHLVHASGHRAATVKEGLAVWGKANMAKYLPGNVLHFAGRQLLGGRFGWPQGGIAAASLLEIVLQIVLPFGLAMLLLLGSGKLAMLEAHGDWPWHLVLLVAAALASALLLVGLRARLPSRLLAPLARLVQPNPAALLPAAFCYLVFFVGMSLIVWALHGLVTGHLSAHELPILAAAFLISWVVGFVVPGAPGGIGVREGSFAVLGGVFLAPDALIIAAVLMRLVTLLGEGLLFLLAVRLARVEPAVGIPRRHDLATGLPVRRMAAAQSPAKRSTA